MIELIWFAVLILLNLIAVGINNFSLASGATVVSLIVAWFWSRDTLNPLFHHPEYFILGGVVYLIIGFFYSQNKYKRQLLKRKESGGSLTSFNPESAKGDIIGWIFWWPFSLIGYIVVDMLCDFGKWVYKQVEGRFQSIFNSVNTK